MREHVFVLLLSESREKVFCEVSRNAANSSENKTRKKDRGEKAAKHSGPQKVAMHVSSMGGVGLWRHMFSQFAQAFAQEFAHHSFEEEGGVYLERRRSFPREKEEFLPVLLLHCQIL